MATITINGHKIKISRETYRRIFRFAAERKIKISQAVFFLLQKVI